MPSHLVSSSPLSWFASPLQVAGVSLLKHLLALDGSFQRLSVLMAPDSFTTPLPAPLPNFLHSLPMPPRRSLCSLSFPPPALQTRALCPQMAWASSVRLSYFTVMSVDSKLCEDRSHLYLAPLRSPTFRLSTPHRAGAWPLCIEGWMGPFNSMGRRKSHFCRIQGFFGTVRPYCSSCEI